MSGLLMGSSALDANPVDSTLLMAAVLNAALDIKTTGVPDGAVQVERARNGILIVVIAGHDATGTDPIDGGTGFEATASWETIHVEHAGEGN